MCMWKYKYMQIYEYDYKHIILYSLLPCLLPSFLPSLPSVLPSFVRSFFLFSFFLSFYLFFFLFFFLFFLSCFLSFFLYFFLSFPFFPIQTYNIYFFWSGLFFMIQHIFLIQKNKLTPISALTQPKVESMSATTLCPCRTFYSLKFSQKHDAAEWKMQNLRSYLEGQEGMLQNCKGLG